MEKIKQNPLLNAMRQPKIYIKLPSNGKYWHNNSLNISVNGEYPVYSMTAKDELLLKTPDALLNGQAIVDVIQSCMPNIINAWETPNIDIDMILIAIRLATYGEMMEMSVDLDSNNSFTYEVDLRTILDQIQTSINWEDRVEVNDQLILYVNPLNYRATTQSSIQRFETQRLISAVNDSSLSDEEKIKTFRESFTKITEVTVGLVASSVYKIESIAGTTDEQEFIQEFMNNCDKSVFDAVKNQLDKMREQNMLKPITVSTTPEMQEQGAAETIEVPIVFDPANFFA
jgi:hypothetical protein